MNVIFRSQSLQYILCSNSITQVCRLNSNAFVQRDVCKQFNISKFNKSRNIQHMAGSDPGEHNEQKTERQTVMVGIYSFLIYINGQLLKLSKFKKSQIKHRYKLQL